MATFNYDTMSWDDLPADTGGFVATSILEGNETDFDKAIQEATDKDPDVVISSPKSQEREIRDIQSQGRDSFSVQYRIEKDEIVANVTILNNYKITQEYRVYMKDSIGQILNKEPDLRWKNIKPSSKASIPISTKWKYSDVGSIGGIIKFQVITQDGRSLGVQSFDIKTGESTEGQEPQDLTLPESQGEGVDISGMNDMSFISDIISDEALTDLKQIGIIAGAIVGGLTLLSFFRK